MKPVDISEVKRNKPYLILTTSKYRKDISFIMHRGRVTRYHNEFKMIRHRHCFNIQAGYYHISPVHIFTTDTLYKEECLFSEQDDHTYEFFELDFSEFAYHVVVEVI